jgi:hypothetical protein
VSTDVVSARVDEAESNPDDAESDPELRSASMAATTRSAAIPITTIHVRRAAIIREGTTLIA